MLLSVNVLAAGTEGALRAQAGVSLDSNARRDFLETGAQLDVVLAGRLRAEGRLWGERGELWGSYDVGARKFIGLGYEDTLIQSASVEGALELLRWLRAGVEGRVKDRRGGGRSYSDMAAEGFVEFLPGARTSIRVRGGGHRYLYWLAPQYSYWAPEVSVLARHRFDGRHAVFASGEVGFRAYDAQALGLRPSETELGPRRDVSVGAQVGYSYRGPFSLSVTYGYLGQGSNSFGESLVRHRLSLSGGVRLPWKLMLLGVLAYQETRYPDGIYLSPELKPLLEDDESHNEVSLRLVRPLAERLDLELSYALYQSALPRNGLTYLRQVGGVGLTFRW